MVSDPQALRLIASFVSDGSEAEIAENFARATFALITEPGDRFAGALIAALSPEQVLELLIARSSSVLINWSCSHWQPGNILRGLHPTGLSYQ